MLSKDDVVFVAGSDADQSTVPNPTEMAQFALDVRADAAASTESEQAFDEDEYDATEIDATRIDPAEFDDEESPDTEPGMTLQEPAETVQNWPPDTLPPGFE